MKLDLLTNATVVDDAIRFVTEKGAGAAVNAEPKTDLPVVIEEERQQQEEMNNKGEQESENSSTSTTNQVF